MANRKHYQREVRKIFKRGGSFSMTLPIEVIKALKWKEKQKVVVKKIKGGFEIKDWKK